MKKSRFGSIYTDSATFGKYYTYFQDIGLGIFSIILIFIGIYLVRKPPVFPDQVQFVVKTVTPQVITTKMDNGATNITTVYNLTGTASSACGTNVISLPQYPNIVNVGDTLTVYVKPNCSGQEANPTPEKMSTFGWIMIGIAILIIIGAVIKTVAVTKFKPLAAMAGASDVFSLARRI